MKTPKFVVVPNLDTVGYLTFWDIVNTKTKEIWASGYFSKSEAEYKAKLFAEQFQELKTYLDGVQNIGENSIMRKRIAEKHAKMLTTKAKGGKS